MTQGYHVPSPANGALVDGDRELEPGTAGPEDDLEADGLRISSAGVDFEGAEGPLRVEEGG
jgi:hypothetical protein